MEPAASKILFITPPYHCGISEVSGRWIPLGLVYLAGAARQAGAEPEIYDAMAKNHGYQEIEKHLRSSKARFVASTAITATVTDAVKTLELAKRTDPAVVTILGGVHPTFMYREVLESFPAVDYVVCGEGEDTLRELLQILQAGGDPAVVPGIAFRREGEIVRTSPRPLMQSIDDVPAAWDLLEWSDYTYFIIPDSTLGAVSTSRGCGHDCTFCSQQKFWDKSWRPRDPLKVADEIEHLYRAYGVNVFLITDEHPTRDAGRWEAFLDAVAAKGLPVRFLMETRVRDIIRDRDILGKYTAAGITHISLGVEAAHQDILNRLRKDAAVDDAKEALDLIHASGMVSEASFILGHPDETAESVRKTLKTAQYYNPDNANFLALTPWPYSDMYESVRQHVRVQDYTKYNLVDPVVEPVEMSLLQMDVALADCYRKFYMGKMFDLMTMKDDFRRGYLLRATKLFMGSAFVLRKLGIGVVGRIPAKVEEFTRKRK